LSSRLSLFVFLSELSIHIPYSPERFNLQVRVDIQLTFPYTYNEDKNRK